VSVEVYAGRGALAELGPELDALQEATGVPITARRRWQQIWVECYPQYEPFVLAVRAGGGLAAAAPLARRWRGPLMEVVGLGLGPSDQLRLPASTPAAAIELSEGVRGLLGRLRSAWRLRIPQLPPGDAVAQGLADLLPFSRLVAAQGSPTTRFTENRTPRSYVSTNHHKQVRRMTNRLRRDGHHERFEVHRHPDDILRLMPEIERVYRARDHQLGRRTKLDHPCHGAFFRAIVSEMASAGTLELLTMHVDERLVAYVINFVDGPSLRMWNCRFDPEWDRYGVGRLANHEALRLALADPAVQEFDWMKGEERYKASLATQVIPSVELLAWSSRSTALVDDMPRRTKQALKPAVQRSERLTRMVTAVRGR
jgi:CelD/BcsL family acetyltransferase involved in cellulose biosynthesis